MKSGGSLFARGGVNVSLVSTVIKVKASILSNKIEAFLLAYPIGFEPTAFRVGV